MLRAAVLTVLLTVSGVSGLLEDIIVTPLSYAEVDAGDFLTFNVVAGSQAGSTSSAEFLYDVRLRDLNAVSPSDYEVYWIRFRPPHGNLPKPPSASGFDPSLVYLSGDFGSTITVDGVLYSVEALSRGDDYHLEVGVRLLTTIQVGQPVSMPHFVLDWWDAPSTDPSRTQGAATPHTQPSATLAAPSVTFSSSTESLVPRSGSSTLVVPGERFTLVTVVHLPEGSMAGAELRVDFPGELLFETVQVTSVQSTVNPVTFLTSVSSSCGDTATVLAQQRVDREDVDVPALPNNADDDGGHDPPPSAVRRLVLPLCTLTNFDRDNDLPDTLTMRVVGTVRGDPWAPRGTTTDVVATFVSNFTTTTVPQGAVTLAVASLTPPQVTPREVEGVLPTDVVHFTFSITHAATSNADAFLVRVQDATLQAADAGTALDPPPRYTIVAVSVDGVSQPDVGGGFARGNLALVNKVDLGGTAEVSVTVLFSDGVEAGSVPLQTPAFQLQVSSHPGSAAARLTTVPAGNAVTATSTRLLTTRILDDGGMQTLQLGPSNNPQPFLLDLITSTYPDCLFLDYVAENADDFCSPDALVGIGTQPSELLDCIPLRLTVPATGCLRVDPTPPPAAPRVTLRTTLSPEFFNTYPALHSTSIVLRDETTGVLKNVPADGSASAPGVCNFESYNAASGAYERTLCAYGTFALVTFGIPPSPSPSPVPLAQRERATVTGDDSVAGTVVLAFGVIVLLVAVLVLGSVVYRQNLGVWPWQTVHEKWLYLKGDPDAIRRHLRDQRAKREAQALKSGRRRLPGTAANRDAPSAVSANVESDVLMPGEGGPSRSRRQRQARRGRRHARQSLHSSDSPTGSRSSSPPSSGDDRGGGGHGRLPPHMDSPQAWSGRYVNPLASRPVSHQRYYYSTAP